MMLTCLRAAVHDDDALDGAVKCQSGKPMRKQMPAEPLNGVCLRDIAAHLSKTLRSIVDEELGVSFLQELIDRTEFTNISGDLDARLGSLVDKFNNKLRSHVDILKQSYNAIYPVLSKTQDRSAYFSQIVDLDIMHNRASDICTRIVTGISRRVNDAADNMPRQCDQYRLSFQHSRQMSGVKSGKACIYYR